MKNSVNIINQIVEQGLDKKLGHLFVKYQENKVGPEIIIEDQPVLNFTSCSYLGLESHCDLKQGVIDAVTQYGTQYSSSRAYGSIDMYDHLEQQLSKLFDATAIVTASTSLGHQSCLPALIHEEDMVLIDHQAHASLQQTSLILKALGVNVQIFKHNDMNDLKQKIKHKKCKFKNIWCVIDGVYSMYGDFAPLNELYQLLTTEDQLKLYVDDAHGMSWTGKNGIGYTRSQIPHHPNMIIATSLNKAFACSGGVLLFKNNDLAKRVRNCGSTLLFSGPIQPPMLGAAIACANLHLSDKITSFQEKLENNITHCNQLISRYGLPVIAQNQAPIFFIACGLPRTAFKLCKKMLDGGFYVNPGTFPAVPLKRGGIRFTLTAAHDVSQIDKLMETMHRHYIKTLQEDSISVDSLAARFQLSAINSAKLTNHTFIARNDDNSLICHVYTSIKEVPQSLWDQHFKDANVDCYQGLIQQEGVFAFNNYVNEHHWRYFYIVITDNQDRVVLMTYLTAQRTKDDMLLNCKISQALEEQRKQDPHHLTSITLNVGSLISEGIFYLDHNHSMASLAIELFFQEAQKIKKQTKAVSVIIRGITPKAHGIFDKKITELGLLRLELPETHVIHQFNWDSEQSFLLSLGQKYRYNVKKEIISKKAEFKHSYSKDISAQQLKYIYQLYLNVKNKSREINTFDLPEAFFESTLKDSNWEIMRLFLKDNPTSEPVAVLFSYNDGHSYAAKFIGLDYNFVRSHNIYKQSLYLALLRAKELGLSPLKLGLTASLEKKKLGATVVQPMGYLQADTFYHIDEIQTKYA